MDTMRQKFQKTPSSVPCFGYDYAAAGAKGRSDAKPTRPSLYKTEVRRPGKILPPAAFSTALTGVEGVRARSKSETAVQKSPVGSPRSVSGSPDVTSRSLKGRHLVQKPSAVNLESVQQPNTKDVSGKAVEERNRLDGSKHLSPISAHVAQPSTDDGKKSLEPGQSAPHSEKSVLHLNVVPHPTSHTLPVAGHLPTFQLPPSPPPAQQQKQVNLPPAPAQNPMLLIPTSNYQSTTFSQFPGSYLILGQQAPVLSTFASVQCPRPTGSQPTNQMQGTLPMTGLPLLANTPVYLVNSSAGALLNPYLSYPQLQPGLLTADVPKTAPEHLQPPLIQPQIAILTADSELLRSLLSGGLGLQQQHQLHQQQSLFQPMLLAAQPAPYLYPDPNAISQRQPTTASYTSIASTPNYSSFSVSPNPPSSTSQPNPTAEVQPPNTGTQAGSESISETLGGQSREVEKPSVEIDKTVISPDRSDRKKSGDSGLEEKGDCKPDTITRTRHSTIAQIQKTTPPSSQTTTEEATAQTRIGNPPRTLKFLAQTEPSDAKTIDHGSLSGKLIHIREPKRLDPMAYLRKFQNNSLKHHSEKHSTGKIGSDIESPIEHTSSLKSKLPEPLSIRDYYQKIKLRERRPLSIYRPSSSIDEVQLPKRPVRFSTDVSQHSSINPSIIGEKPAVNTHFREHSEARQFRPPLRRAATFVTDDTGQITPAVEYDDSSTKNQLQSRDYSILTVAERAKQWLAESKRGAMGNHRHSTFGFIDQDLIDCQELIPVEDRVRMFNSGHTQKQGKNANAELSQPIQPTKTAPMCTAETHTQSKKTILSKTNASVLLSSKKPSYDIVKEYRPNSGLQRILLDNSDRTSDSTHPPLDANYGFGETLPQSPQDRLSGLSIQEKRHLFTRGEEKLKAPQRIRRKTQPVTLDDLARANQIILARLDGRRLESTSTLQRDDDSVCFQERSLELSSPEASQQSL